MKSVQIKDKTFTLSIPAEKIQEEVKRVAEQINKDLAGTNPVFICVLNGAFMFAGDLMKYITIPCEVTFVKLSSYEGIISTGKVKEVLGLSEDIEGRTIVIVEDIIDTGLTMAKIIDSLHRFHPKEFKVASFLQKPDALQVQVPLDYVAIKIPNDFIVGYGLDYDGFGRNLPHIYTLAK
jgi:hypoxanthine phosphoribosyltransferase